MQTSLLAVVAAVLAAAQGYPSHNWITPPEPPNHDDMVIGYYSGNELFSLCEQNPNACTAYIVGVTDGHLSTVFGTNRTRVYCIPKGSNSIQVRDVVVKFLRDHPEERHLLGSVIVAEALSQVWPAC